jgi:uncharacterized protein (UPF0261 family)
MTPSLQRILERERIHHSGEHAHVVGGRSFHAGGAGGEAAENIAAANDNGNLDIQGHDVGDFLRQAFENRGLNTVALLTGQHLPADFQKEAPVVCRAHAWPN